MSLFGPVTTAEIRGWQCAAALLLHELLQRAHREHLPPVTWTLPDLGNLIARSDSADDWTAWQAALQLADVRPPIAHGGRVRHRASGIVQTSRGRHVTVTLLADLHPDSPGHHDGPPRGAA